MCVCVCVCVCGSYQHLENVSKGLVNYLYEII